MGVEQNITGWADGGGWCHGVQPASAPTFMPSVSLSRSALSRLLDMCLRLPIYWQTFPWRVALFQARLHGNARQTVAMAVYLWRPGDNLIHQ